MRLTKVQIQRVPCPKCGVSADHHCVRRVPEGLFKTKIFPRQHSHYERMIQAREKVRFGRGAGEPTIRQLLG